MKHTKTIIILLFFIFLIVMINSFFVIYLIQNNEIKNAYIINELGQIRGGIQRYSKLKLINLEKDKIKIVQKYVNEKFNDVRNIYKEIIPNEAIEFFEKNFFELEKNWKKLKNSKKPKMIYLLSEKIWEIADPLVIYTAKAIENKTQKILFFIISLSIITILSILIIIFIIYDVISKNLKIKTLKDPISKLYNKYHLNEILEILQNRYQRYQKTFGIFKIDLKNINEKILKDISKTLKENIRRSDKIFNIKNTIIIILLEPDKIDLTEYKKRIELLLNPHIKNSNIIIYNGEKIENLI
jgi:two-component system cell cycle response regulator